MQTKDSYRVEQICGVYFESFIDDYYRKEGVLDSFVLLKFALNCRAARDVIAREHAKILLFIRNMLCHKSPKFWTTKDEAHDDAGDGGVLGGVASIRDGRSWKNREVRLSF